MIQQLDARAPATRDDLTRRAVVWLTWWRRPASHDYVTINADYTT